MNGLLIAFAKALPKLKPTDKHTIKPGPAVAAYGGGLSRDIFISYNPAFITAGISCFVATGLIIYFMSFRTSLSK